jgi:hypothetical protein
MATKIDAAVKTTEVVAQQLQKRRENYTKTLDALPMPKARIADFPYESMAEAVKDGFALIDGEAEGAFALLVKGYKTAAWRKAAEKNRVARDAAAEGEVPAALAKRVAKTIEAEKAEKAEA